jgi:hypothetical protein
MTAEEQLIEDIGGYCADPLGYARYAYPWNEPGELQESAGPREWQREILSIIGAHLRSEKRFEPLQIAVASGHGIGKSALMAMIIDWGMSTCEDCRIVVTANTESQLRTKTWPEICKWSKLAINTHWFNPTATTLHIKDKGHERLWRCDAIPWSENNTEAFAGLHNKGKRIIVLLDEGSAIPKIIWQVIEGALTDEDTEILFIVFGNPTKNAGAFHECFNLRKHRWITRQIDSRNVEGTNKAQIAKWIADYGEDSDFVRVRVRGEFPRAGSSQFIAGDLVANARKRNLAEKDYAHAWKILSVDVARFGDDQTVIGLRQGPKLTILDRVRGQDTMQVAQRVMARMKEHDPRVTVIDGDGIGAGVIDRINEELPSARRMFEPDNPLHEWAKRNPNHTLQEFHGGATPQDPFMYFNRRAEAWGKLRGWLETADIPDEPEIETDLTGPEYGFSAKNQIQLERKEDMKKRGLSSPDLGDMMAMSTVAMPSGETEEEALRKRLAEIQDPLWQRIQKVKATLDREARQVEDNRPEWMREG